MENEDQLPPNSPGLPGATGLPQQPCASGAPEDVAPVPPSTPDNPDLPVSPGEPELLPVDPALVNALPSYAPFSLRDLIDALRNHRVLIVRLGGVSIAALIAIVGSIFIHILAGAILVSVTLYGPAISAWLFGQSTHAHDTWAADENDAGGGPHGGFVLAKTADPSPPGSLSPDLLGALAKSSHALEHLPAPSMAPEYSADRANAFIAPETTPPIAPFPSPDIIAAPRFAHPLLPLPPTPAPTTGPTVAVIGPRVTGVASNANTRNPGNALASGDPDGEGEEGTIDLIKHGSGSGTGSGSGQGSGHGNGIDRGPSAANLEHPAVIEAPQPEIPMEIQAKAIGKHVLFEVTVEPDGRASTIKILHPSGVPALDAICQATVARYKFRPAYRDGHAISAPYQIGFSDGSSDN